MKTTREGVEERKAEVQKVASEDSRSCLCWLMVPAAEKKKKRMNVDY
jgi:hypothetical protein